MKSVQSIFGATQRRKAAYFPELGEILVTWFHAIAGPFLTVSMYQSVPVDGHPELTCFRGSFQIPADSGLACHLPGIDTAAELAKSPFIGTLFEEIIASEIVKAQANAGTRRELYHFRDQQGLEVDFLMPRRGGSMVLVECKASRTVTPAMTAALRQLGAAMKGKRGSASVEMLLVHQSPDAGTSTQAVAPGVRALAWQRFVAEL